MSLRLAIASAAIGVLASGAFAEPRLQVSAVNGLARVELIGEYAQSRYTVFRANDPAGPWEPVSSFDLLCLDRCFVDDAAAKPGHTYWYRFDVQTTNGASLAIGPLAATIPASISRVMGARVVPNPASGPTSVELYLAGRAVEPRLRVEARILDVQGRRVRALFDGSLPRGLSTIRWDGLDDAGRATEPGVYVVWLRSPLGVTATRLTRIR